jgi:hypothetical protein
MSIAQAQKIKELEQKLKELADRVALLENRPRPGRPPKQDEPCYKTVN